MKQHSSEIKRVTGRPCRLLLPLVILSVTGVLLALPVATRAEARPAPDSLLLALMRFELRHFDDVRVYTGGAKILTHRPVVSSEGLQFGSDPGGWSITAPSQERLVSWAEVESIQARRGASGSPVLLCALAGLAIGSAIAIVDAFGHAFTLSPSKKNTGTPILVGVAGGATFGWLIDRPGQWESVYP